MQHNLDVEKEIDRIYYWTHWDEIGPKPDLSNISLKNKQECNNECKRYDK